MQICQNIYYLMFVYNLLTENDKSVKKFSVLITNIICLWLTFRQAPCTDPEGGQGVWTPP